MGGENMVREMKDSGIEWIGEIPADWNVAPIGYSTKWKSVKGCPDEQVLSLYREYGVIPKDSRDDNHNVTSLDTSGYKLVDKGDFVINKMKAWQGSMGLSDYRGIISPAYHVCEINNKNVHKKYFHYLLRNQSYLPEYERLSTGLRVGQWDLAYDDFKKIPFLIPPYDEQKRIVNEIEKKCVQIDTALEKTRTTIEEYKKLKQAIITKAVTKGIRGDRPMKDSGIEWIGEIPAEWKIINGHRIVLGTQNGLTRRDLEKSTGSIVLKLKNISPEGNIDYSESNRISLTDKEEDTYKLTEGDFIFVRVNGSKSLVGKCAIFKDIGEMVAYNDHIIRVKYNNLLDKKFIQWYMLSSAGKSEINKYTSTAAGQFTISGEGIRNITFVYPPTNEQQEIADYLDKKCATIDTLIAKKEQIITDLKSYKKSLIYEYVTGKKETML